jgi:hypothetical protein
MALSLQVVYPVDGGTRFDMEYYLDTHMALVGEQMGPHIEQTLVTRGVSGGAPDTPPPFYAVATCGHGRRRAGARRHPQFHRHHPANAGGRGGSVGPAAPAGPVRIDLEMAGQSCFTRLDLGGCRRA